MVRRSDLPVQEKLARLEQWRASGMKLKDYLAPMGEDVAMWTSWLRWERHWREREASPVKPERGAATGSATGKGKRGHFVRAIAVGVAPVKPAAALAALEMVIHGGGDSRLRVQVCWPVGQEQASAQWLREVLK